MHSFGSSEIADPAGAEPVGDTLEIRRLTYSDLPVVLAIERRLDDAVDELEVMARGDLGHHAAEALVERGLGRDHVGEHPRSVDDRGAGVVAGRLQRQYQSRHLLRSRSLALTGLIILLARSRVRGWRGFG